MDKIPYYPYMERQSTSETNDSTMITETDQRYVGKLALEQSVESIETHTIQERARAIRDRFDAQKKRSVKSLLPNALRLIEVKQSEAQ